MTVTIVGPGRLGRSLALLLERAGLSVSSVGRVGPLPDSEVVLLTVPDDRIAESAHRVPTGRIVLHCSGAADVDILRPHRPAGSFHPLMTFPGPDVALPDLRGVPAAVAGDPQAISAARDLADALGMEAFEVSGDRALYHCAAVMAGNFATVLLAEAARALTAAGVPASRSPALLAPLALASLNNARRDPAASLTGPAARGDRSTVERHQAALTAHGLHDLRRLYDVSTAAAERLANAPNSRDHGDGGA